MHDHDNTLQVYSALQVNAIIVMGAPICKCCDALCSVSNLKRRSDDNELVVAVEPTWHAIADLAKINKTTRQTEIPYRLNETFSLLPLPGPPISQPPYAGVAPSSRLLPLTPPCNPFSACISHFIYPTTIHPHSRNNKQSWKNNKSPFQLYAGNEMSRAFKIKSRFVADGDFWILHTCTLEDKPGKEEIWVKSWTPSPSLRQEPEAWIGRPPPSLWVSECKVQVESDESASKCVPCT